MLLLKNNFFAWLWEAKLTYKDILVTDNDGYNQTKNNENIGDAYVNLEVNLEPIAAPGGEDDDGTGINFNNELIREGDPIYEELHKKTELEIKKIRQFARGNVK